MWSIMNLFFGGPPEESLKRQVGEKASGPDVSEKTGSRHNEKYELQEEYGITLTIYSQKTKPNDHEEDNL